MPVPKKEVAPINLFDLYAKIAIDTSEYEKGVKGATKESSGLISKFKDIDKTSETTKNKINLLSNQYSTAKSNVEKLTDAFNKSAKENGYASDETQRLAQELKEAESKATGLKSELDSLSNATEKVGDSTGSLASKLKSGLATAGKVAATGITAIAGAAATAVGGLLSLESSTEEYRVAMGKLTTAFESSAMGAEHAQGIYNGFYQILGDTDTATEASQLLAKLTDNVGDAATWIEIAAGVSGTFGDSLPIEGLIEAANETAKVGQVTGTLADALNWVGISEDDFNAKLEACSSESARNQLITETLSKTYEKASEAFYENNDALIQSRINQTQLDNALSTLGQTVSEVKNSLMSEFIPAVSDVATAFNGMLKGTDGAEKSFSQAVQSLINTATKKLPGFLNLGVKILDSLVSGIISALPSIVNSAIQAVETLIDTILEQLPALSTSAIQILLALANGISTNLPTLVPSIVSVIMQIIQTLISNIPMLLNAGLQLIIGLAQGIINSIPTLVGYIPTVITSIVDTLLLSIPLIIDAGIQLLTSLVGALPEIISEIVAAIPIILNGIITALIDSIPLIVQAGIDLLVALIQNLPQIITTIVQAIPKIIDGIVSALINNIDKIIMAGVQLFIALVENLPTIIAEIVKAVPEIIAGIVQAVLNGVGKMAEAGLNLLRGLWDGISSGVQWLWDQISGWLSGLWDSILGFFGIHSPSTEMAWVGEMLVKGLSGAIKDNGDEAVKAAESMANDITDVMDNLAEGMETTFPTDFSVNAKSSLAGLNESYYRREAPIKNSARNAPTINIIINGARYSDEQNLARAIAEELQYMKSRREAVFA